MLFYGAPSMGALRRVQVPSQVDQASEALAQLREGYADNEHVLTGDFNE